MVTPAGPISIPISKMKTLISESSNFQTWTGAANAAAALAFIHIAGIDSGYTRPLALILAGKPALSLPLKSAGAAMRYSERGQIHILFEDEVDAANQASHEDAFYEFANNLGLTLGDMDGLAGSSDNLAAAGFDVIDGPARSDPDEKEPDDDYYQALVAVDWGF